MFYGGIKYTIWETDTKFPLNFFLEISIILFLTISAGKEFQILTIDYLKKMFCFVWSKSNWIFKTDNLVAVYAKIC